MDEIVFGEVEWGNLRRNNKTTNVGIWLKYSKRSLFLNWLEAILGLDKWVYRVMWHLVAKWLKAVKKKKKRGGGKLTGKMRNSVTGNVFVIVEQMEGQVGVNQSD